MPTDWTALTALQALALLRDGSLSVEAYARACLARIADREPSLHAWAFVDPDFVIRQARTLDAQTARGALHGLPIGVKDVILTADMPTQYNSEIYRGARQGMDAACVTLLRAAGALILGKTETVEFAATGRPARTRNPRDFVRTPGGSSSGSAAAVADRHVPLALGTQTGGSMIRPASFCGVFGMKPTFGLVSREGAKQFAPSLDTIGWFARSAQDLAMLYDVFDPAPAAAHDFHIAGSRIAVCRSPVWHFAAEETQAALADAEDRLRMAGADVTRIDLPAPFADLAALQGLIMGAEGASSFLAEYRIGRDLLHPKLRNLVENKAGVSRAALADAYDASAACRKCFDAIAAEFDAVLTPSAVGEAPLGLAETGAMTFNAMWTLLHVPCVNVPSFAGPSGMPVGVTLTGPRYSDRKVLEVATAFSALSGRP